MGCSSNGCNEQSKEHSENGWITIAVSGIAFFSGLLIHFLKASVLASSLLLILTLILSGYEIAVSGIRNLLNRHVSINLLITIAAIGSLLIGHIEESAAVVFLFSLAERLEDYAADRARGSIEALMELKPETAKIRREGEEVTVPVKNVLPGEVFVVRPGSRIPLDGVLIEGNSTVDQATITGESMPVFKQVGDDVYSGTMNVDGFLAVEVTQIADESLLSKILLMVEKAGENRSSTETFIDRFASIYTPTVILIAILLAVLPPLIWNQPLNHWVYRALVMLVVACPCALALSTPIAMVSAITSAGRNGVLVKGSTHLEQLEKTKTFAFDKTGTLTKGTLRVTDVVSLGFSEKEILRKAASLEAKSEHPIAKAILDKAKEEGAKIEKTTEFKSYVGRGAQACISDKTCCIGNPQLFQELGIDPIEGIVEKLEAEGKTVVLVSEENCTIGAIALMDEERDQVEETITKLKQNKIRVEMLTGDNDATAKAVSQKLGFDGYIAHLLPEEKATAIEELQRKHGVVAMIGDGVNDAPALAAADVGIAMGSIGSDIALETADIALMDDNISRMTYLVELGKATMSRIRENITFSILLKMVIAALAFNGLISLWMAVAIGDMGLSLAVIVNAMRLARISTN
jgi:Cd2+/Zn2+-exporting ATPase